MRNAEAHSQKLTPGELHALQRKMWSAGVAVDLADAADMNLRWDEQSELFYELTCLQCDVVNYMNGHAVSYLP